MGIASSLPRVNSKNSLRPRLKRRSAQRYLAESLEQRRLLSTNLLVNGDFESEPNFTDSNAAAGYALFTGDQIPGWTIVAGHGVTVHNTLEYPTISGNYSVNTDGEGFGGNNADFYQDFGTVNGAPYQLAFDWQGWVDYVPGTKLNVTLTDTVTNAALFNGLYTWNGEGVLSHITDNFQGTGNPVSLEIKENPQSGENDDMYIVDNFSVTGAAPTLKVSQEPADTPVNQKIAPVQVTVLNPDGSTDTSSTEPITVSISSDSTGMGSLSGTTTQNAIAGIATFNDLSIDEAGQYKLAFNDNSGDTTPEATSTPFNVKSPLTWTGGGDGVSWSDPENWSTSAAPTNGDSLIFPTGAPLSSNNDIAGLSINTIDIQGGGYKLTGNAISLTGGLTSEAGKNTYNIDTTLVGSPTLDDQTGDLTIASVLSGAGLTIAGSGIDTFDQTDTYSGTTTLDSGVTIDDDALSDAFSTGPLTIGAGASPVTIDDTGSGAATLENDVTFQDGSTLATDPEVILSGTVTVNGQDSLAPTHTSDVIKLDGSTIEGTGTLLVKALGTVMIQGDLISTVQVEVDSGELDLAANLQAAVDGASQITVKGGTLKLLSGLSGTGGIDIKSGLLESSSDLSGYSGTITLESNFKASAEAVLTPNTDVLGTGQVIVGTVLTTNGENYPTIGVATGGKLLTLNNPVTFQNGGGLAIKGSVTFTGAVTLGGPASLFTTANTDQVAVNGGMLGTGTVQLGGPGTDTFNGDIAAGVGLNATYKANDTTPSSTQLSLGANLMGALDGASQVVSDCTLKLLSTLSGTGGIDLEGGTLKSGGVLSYSGAVTLEAKFANNSSTVTLTSGAFPLGDGPLVVATPSDDSIPSSRSIYAPTLDVSEAKKGLSLSNALTVQNDGELHTYGDVTFTDAVTVSGTGTIYDSFDVKNGGTLTLKNGVQGAGTLQVYGDSSNTVTGSIAGESTLVSFGTMNLGAKLKRAVGDASQFVDGSGTTQLMAGFSGTGGINVIGMLQTSKTIPYSGNINLLNGAVEVLTPDANALGTGDINDDASYNGVTIDATAVLQGITLNNALNLQKNSKLAIKGFVTFTDVVTLNGGQDFIEPVGSSDQLVLSKGVQGTGKIVFTGQGTTTLTGDIDAGVDITVGDLLNDDGLLDLGGGLLGPAGGASQVTVFGGTLRLLSGLSGIGGIDLKAGTLKSGGVSGYDGTVTLEQQTGALLGFSDTTAGANVILTSNTSALGTGPIVMAAPVLSTESGFNNTINSPTINATGAPSGVTLGNDVTFQSDANLIIQGSLSFGNAPVLNGPIQLTTTNGTDELSFPAGIQGKGTVTFDGPGTTSVGGIVDADVALNTAATNTGVLHIGANLRGTAAGASQVVINGGIVELLIDTAGSGGINVLGGTLVTDKTPGNGGAENYKGTVKLGADGTIKDYDSVDAKGLGTGKLVLNGGLLQNSSGGTAIINNPVTVNGSVTTSSRGNKLKFSDSVNITGSGAIDVVGILALTGLLTGSGSITLDGDLLAVAGSNPDFKGNVIVNSGTVEVAEDDALGTGPLTANLKGQGVLESVASIGDPILDNPVTIKSGTLSVQGQFTFPHGVTIKSGAELEIDGAGSNIIISGALAGSGKIVINGGAFSVLGSTASFTGSIKKGQPAGPMITTDPSSQSVTPGTDVVFNAFASGDPIPAVQWMVEDAGAKTFTSIPGATSTTLNLGPAALSASGNKYEAVFTNSHSKATTSAATLTVNAVVVQPVITALYLVDTNNGRRLFALTNGITINLATLPTLHLTIEAVTDPAQVGSIAFKLDSSSAHVENYNPYDLFGDSGFGHFVPGKITTGHHVLVVTPFSKHNQDGKQGPALTVHFTVTDIGTTAP